MEYKNPQAFNLLQEYLTCSFTRGQWYEISYKSSIRYEIYYKKTYRTFWSNYSSIFLVKPDYSLASNNTELEWLKKLITMKIR